MAKNKKKIVFAGGWTGGHIIPLISLYKYLKEDWKFEFLWLGERDSLEENAASENKIKFRDISAGRIRRYFDWRNFYEPLKNLTGICESIFYILRYKWDIIFSKGGFVSLPVCIAGKLLFKKIYIHESDSVMGLANKISSVFATKIFYSFPNDKTAFSWTENKGKSNKHIHSGHILNSDLLDGIKDIKWGDNEKLTVLVIAWSQGSTKIFENLIKILPDCNDIDFHIILWTENRDFKEKFESFTHVKSYDFISQKKLWKLMKDSDIAITRGSSTLWELYYFGIHSIIIPLKTTGGNHQYYNAQYFNENFGSDILDEDENLHLEIFRKLQKYKGLRKADLNLEGFLDGIKTITKEIES